MPTIQELIDILKLSESDAEELHTMMQSWEWEEYAKDEPTVDDVMTRANEMLGGFGVESLESEYAYVSSYFQNIIALYVNMGETYNNTLIFDTEREEFLISSWGDFFESWEVENQDKDEDEE